MKGIIFGVEDTSAPKRQGGAHRIATFLREHDWDIEVIDFTLWWSLDELKALAKSRFDKDTKWIGVSSLFTDTKLGTFGEFLVWVKITYPDIKTIFGSQVKLPKQYSFIDYNINGFGEHALLVLLKYLFSNGDSPKFSMFLNSGRNIPANEYYPSYPMKSLMIKYEDRDFIQSYEWLSVEFARGCKFSCDFCNFPVIGVKGDYTRDADDFRLHMMDAYDRFGVQYYAVSDETFNDRTAKITKFADVVETLPFAPFFTGFIRADLLISRKNEKEELLRMGFLGQFYGVETFNHETGKSIGKGMHPDKIKQGLIDIKNYFKSHGNNYYRGYISLIAGLPHETMESLDVTKQWLLDNWKGESFSVFALEIPISEYDYPSSISMNYKKYGYKDASGDADVQNLKDDYNRYNIITDVLLWKNEHMSVRDAARIAKDIEWIRDNPASSYNAKVPNFSLVDLGLPDNLEDRLSVDFQYIFSSNTIRTNTLNTRIKDYIQKKLGL